MLIFLVLNLLISNLSFAQINKIIVNNGESIYINNPGYPQNALSLTANLEWHYQAKPSNAKLKVTCSDIRMNQNTPWTEDCSNIYISFIDGNEETKVCGENMSGFKFETNGQMLAIRVFTNLASGYFNCEIKSFIPSPALNIVELKLNDPPKVLKLPRKEAVHLDRGWIIRSPEGSRIKLDCSLNLGPIIKPCEDDIITIGNDGLITKYCNTEMISIQTMSNAANIRIQMGNTSNKSFQCNVEAISGNVETAEHHTVLPPTTITPPSPTVNVPITSSEYGVADGNKNTTCNCGRSNKPRARIVNGIQASEHEFPWIVSYYAKFPTGRGIIHYQTCGGSIITQRHILTAAHCLYRDRVILVGDKNVHITLAEHNLVITSPREVMVSSQRIYVHENYHAYRYKDIAIIFTKETIEYNRFISPVCLTPVLLPHLHDQVLIMGWGQTVRGGPTGIGSDILLKAKTRVVENCYVPQYEVCTESTPTSACYGDSGSPVVVVDPETNRYTQTFLVSRGPQCSYGMNIQTDVVYFYDWIQNIIQNSDSSQTTCQKV